MEKEKKNELRNALLVIKNHCDSYGVGRDKACCKCTFYNPRIYTECKLSNIPSFWEIKYTVQDVKDFIKKSHVTTDDTNRRYFLPGDAETLIRMIETL